MSICCGFSKAGLPVGMQLVGNAFDEPNVFKVGDAYQSLTEWHLATPPAETVKERQPA
jgi:aspartyl-tRNA(Asn)/glutamyl-tRNA(Gln) amidotransferase subunit A